MSLSRAPIPQISSPVHFKGSVSFPCCGVNHVQQGENLDSVICPLCRVVYHFHLEPRFPGVEKYPKGSEVILKEDLEIKVGSKEVKVKKGSNR